MANDVIRNSVSLGGLGSDCIISRSDFPDPGPEVETEDDYRQQLLAFFDPLLSLTVSIAGELSI
jgi:hypothetical protein